MKTNKFRRRREARQAYKRSLKQWRRSYPPIIYIKARREWRQYKPLKEDYE